MEKIGVFKTFFLFLNLDIKKCPKPILKKKFAKMKITFFSTFFFTFFLYFYMIHDNMNFCKMDAETIRKKVKKLDFFGFFQYFLGFFQDFLGLDGKRLDNFGQLLDNFIGTFQYKNDSNKIFMDYIR